jgi:hypothetical protein
VRHRDSMAAPAWQAPRAVLGKSVWVQTGKWDGAYPLMVALSDLMNRRKASEDTL